MITTLDKLASFCDVSADKMQEEMHVIKARIDRGAMPPDISPIGHIFVKHVRDTWWLPINRWMWDRMQNGEHTPTIGLMSGEEILDMLSEFINYVMRDEENYA